MRSAMLSMLGSSPLARGTLGNRAKGHSYARLIPARAGNMLEAMKTRAALAAHPRSRGEHSSKSASTPVCFGSSPLARGTFNCRRVLEYRRRLIPARAGNMAVCGGELAVQAAHPRSRGEHPVPQVVSVRPSGSSPLARGTWRSPPYARFPMRLIPARAGNMYGKIV